MVFTTTYKTCEECGDGFTGSKNVCMECRAKYNSVGLEVVS